MFCNQCHLKHSSNKLWAERFQTSLVTQSFILSSLAIHELCDECRQHLSSSCGDLNLWETDHLSLYSLIITHPYTIYPYSRHTHLDILQRLSSSTSIFPSVIAFCRFWCVICFSSLKESFIRISGRDSF
jgi:hypothetical protein